MRALLLPAVLFAAPALAETIEAAGPVTAVTLYPDGATVTRTVAFEAPAPGRHEIVVPLPVWVDPATLRVAAPEGVGIATIRLAEDRPPAAYAPDSPAVKAAEAEVRRLEAVLRDKRRAIAEIRAEGEAAQARADFLQVLAARQGEQKLAAADTEGLSALAALVGAEVLAARKAALRAEDAAVAAEIALQEDLRAHARAKAALEALQAPPTEGAALILGVDVAAAGPAALTVEALETEAGWSPVYDLRLTRAPDALTIARGVLVSQDSGEDWQGVALTLSTARPSAQAAPSELWPLLRRIEPEPPPLPEPLDMMAGAAPPLAEAAMEPAPAPARAGFETAVQGLVFSFRFSEPVDIRTGADALRLAMDEVAGSDLTVRAEAVPAHDATAFLVAEFRNATGQPLLPGPATLYADGAMTGAATLPLVPDGGTVRLGFGAIDGLVLRRTVPDRSSGEEGLISTSNRQSERVLIEVENLTGRAWPLRVTDQVPYSEQDDLAIDWRADPRPATDSAEGRRGILTWEFDLAPGETRRITLETTLSWPAGMVLR